MAKKVLNYALRAALSTIAPLSFAQTTQVPPATPSAASDLQCTPDVCRAADGTLLFRLQTRGEQDAKQQQTNSPSDTQRLQPDRHVTIEGSAPQPLPAAAPGKAVASGKFSVQLPNGGAIWATEDPTLGIAQLSISAPSMVAFENGRIKAPVQFFTRSNYPDFIKRYELQIFRADDTAQTEPLATVPIKVAAVSSAEWDGQMTPRFPLRAGDSLMYVLRAYGANGEVDETLPRTFDLLRPEDVERGTILLRDSTEKTLGASLSLSQAQTQKQIDTIFGSNDLRQQNIPIYGSRIRIQGRNLPENANLEINGDSYPTDLERKFVAEFLAPVGSHRYDIAVKMDKQADLKFALDVEVTGKYSFGVAMADLTVFQNRATGEGQQVALSGREEDVLTNGRLAFYGKTKIDGKYLITAQADTQERDIHDMFSGFGKAYPSDIFLRLDPNYYYPTYGDDSTTVRDVDTQGRFYFRVDWDKNQALWGNYNTGLTGTEYAQYVRSLYGAALKWRSADANPWGEPAQQLRVFGSQAQTAPGHSEFLGTGGSLYYLRNTDILPGSDVLTLEVRNPNTGSVENRRVLQRGVDYEINELQGRVLLTQALTQRTTLNQTSITRDAPLAGYDQYLLVDYEWEPSGFDTGNVTGGIRAKSWVTDNVAIGGTYVDESRAGENYLLQGVDLTLQAGRGTTLKIEHSKTEATSAPVFFSSNGGFSFTQTNSVAGPREGTATSINGQANLKELGWTERNWSLGAWWRHVDAGYSITRADTGQERREYGAQVRGQIADTLEIYAIQSRVERGTERQDQTQVTAQWRPTDDDTVSAELRRITQARSTGDVNGTLGALKYQRRVIPSLDVYGIAQLTLDDDGGNYEDNNAYTLGALYRFGDLSTIGAEATHGDRGNAAQVNAEYRLAPEHSLYGAVNYTTDTSAYDSIFNPRLQNGWTAGQRWRVGENSNLFNESQFLKSPEGNGIANTFGMDFFPAVGWTAGFTLQKGDLSTSAGDVHRQAVSVSAGRTSPDTEWRSKLEWRQDSGAEQRRQWVSTNRVNQKVNEDWRVSARYNYSDTQDNLNAAAGAKYIEGGLGFAWRPHDTTRYALLGRYTYLYDLATLGQEGGAQYDQKSNIVSLEGVYKYNQHWEFAGHLAHREGQARMGRGSGDWFDSATSFAAAQVRYTLPYAWYALVEQRWLNVKNGGSQNGWLLGIDRDITKNLRIGVGYNFTNFSDDLTKFDYKYKGWFINLVGTY